MPQNSKGQTLRKAAVNIRVGPIFKNSFRGVSLKLKIASFLVGNRDEVEKVL